MTADQLRAKVVLFVVRAIAALTFLLYALCGALLFYAAAKGANLEVAVPGWLTLAAGSASGSLITLLLNSKGNSETHDNGQAAAPVPDDGVPYEEQQHFDVR